MTEPDGTPREEGAGNRAGGPDSTVRFVGIWGVDEQRSVLAAIADVERRIRSRCDWRCRCERRDGTYDYRIELTTTSRVVRAQSLEDACRQLARWKPEGEG